MSSVSPCVVVPGACSYNLLASFYKDNEKIICPTLRIEYKGIVEQAIRGELDVVIPSEYHSALRSYDPCRLISKITGKDLEE